MDNLLGSSKEYIYYTAWRLQGAPSCSASPEAGLYSAHIHGATLQHDTNMAICRGGEGVEQSIKGMKIAGEEETFMGVKVMCVYTGWKYYRG
jgi:hypothetical protein